MTTTPPSIAALPAAPDPTNRATFNTLAYPWSAALPTFGTEVSAVAANVKANADEAAASAVSAAASVVSAAASVAAAQGAAAAAGAVVWVSGTTYAIGDVRYSPTDSQTYRRITSGAGTTDPSADATNWTRVQFGFGTGGTTSTASITLTASSAAAMSVTPATPGLYATLPDAMTCAKADNLFSIYNAGDYDFGVKNSAGTQLGWVRPRTGAMIGLADSSTAAGVWACYGLEKLGTTALYVNTTTANSDNFLRRIALDANRTCFLWGGVDCYAIVYDASTQTWGSAALVRATVASGAFIGVLSATNQVLVVSCNSTTGMEAVTLTIASNVITVNTGTKTTATLAGNWTSFSQLIAVSTSWVLGYCRATTVAGIRAITVSGTTPTIGAESAVTPSTATPPSLFASGSIVRTISASASGIYAKPFTVSGSTLSAGTEAAPTASAAEFRAFQNGNGNIVCNYINTTHYAAIFKLTGTVEAGSSVSLGTTPASAILTRTEYQQITSSKTVYVANAASTSWYANILTDTGGTATAGTEISGIVATSLTYVAACGVSGNMARFAQGSPASFGQITLDCSGTSPVLSEHNRASTASALLGSPVASNQYGVRSGKTLVAGASCYALSAASGPYDQLITAHSIERLIALSVTPVYASAGGLAGAANETFVGSVTAGSTGYSIQRIEAAE